MSNDRQNERSRIEAILTSSHAAGRAELAQHLAFRTDETADAATKILASAATGAPGANGTLSPEQLAEKMNALYGVNTTKPAAGAQGASGALSAEEVARRVSTGA